MTAKDIERALERKYQNALYTVPNVYFFGWESDFLVVQQSGLIFEVESKISRADYFNDFNKAEKHRLLKDKTDISYKGSDYEVIEQPANTRNLPNRFYYACPTNLIKVEEIPEYAGLFYVDENGAVTEVKKAPILHKDKIEYSKKLITKFYYGYLDAKRLKQDTVIQDLNKQIRQLNKKLRENESYMLKRQYEYSDLLREFKQLQRSINAKNFPSD